MRHSSDIMYKNHCLPDFSWSNHRHRNCCCRPTLFRHVVRVVVYRRVDCWKCSAVVRVSFFRLWFVTESHVRTNAARRVPSARRLRSLAALAVVTKTTRRRGEVNWQKGDKRTGGPTADECRPKTRRTYWSSDRWTVCGRAAVMMGLRWRYGGGNIPGSPAAPARRTLPAATDTNRIATRKIYYYNYYYYYCCSLLVISFYLLVITDYSFSWLLLISY